MRYKYVKPRPEHLWKKGTSGNPGGRPKAVKELMELARAAVPRAIQFAIDLLDDDDADNRVRLEAVKFLALYGIGTPPKVAESEAPTDPVGELKRLTVEELRSLARGEHLRALPPPEESPEETAEDGPDDEPDEPH